MNISTDNQNMPDREYFAVIDTETNWQNEVISIGVVIARTETYHIAAEKYYVITPECEQPSMYGYMLDKYKPLMKCERAKAISDLRSLLMRYYVENIFAYNARFDYNHLPELNGFIWHDIMRIAAYKQYNACISGEVECCSTGRMKSDYGVESMLRMLLKDERYFEKHNAAYDAKDELLIMQMIGYPTDQYPNIQDVSMIKKPAYTRLEKHELRKNELQKHLSEGNIDLISFEATNKPVTIKCKQCEHSWNVSYLSASNKMPKCPKCFPIVKSKPSKRKMSSERLHTKAKNYADLISARSDGTLKIIEYRGSNEKVRVMCAVCLHIWEIRADHLKTRCYCPQCKKQGKTSIT